MNKIYKSKLGITTPGNIRGGAIFETHKTQKDKKGNIIEINDIYINDLNNIVGIKSDRINNGKLIGTKTNKKINIGISSIVIGILESGKQEEYYKNQYEYAYYKEKRYEDLDEFLKEMTVGYNFLIDKIILNEKYFK